MKTKNKILIVYYSYSGHTKSVAEELAKELDADLDEITDCTNRRGAIGMIRSGFDVIRKQKPDIKTTYNPSLYDIVILGTPVWAGSITPALRSYCLDHASILKESYACFTTQQSASPQNAFTHLSTIIGSLPHETVSLQTSLIKKKSFRAHLKPFLKSISSLCDQSKRQVRPTTKNTKKN